MTNAVAPINDIRDIKPLATIPSISPWIWLGIALLIIAGCVGLLIWYLRRRPKTPAAPPVPAHVRAKQKLEEALALISQPKPFCIAVSDTTRWYLEERFKFRAPERTTEEFLHELRNTNLLLPDQKDSLGEFLQRCDLVKFAKYEPGEPELRDLHGSALRLIDETEPQPESAGSDHAPRTTDHASP